MPDIPQKIEYYIGQRRLRDAFSELRAFVSKLGDWHITDEVDRVEQSYSMMLRYASTGADDPGGPKGGGRRLPPAGLHGYAVKADLSHTGGCLRGGGTWESDRNN